LQLFFLLSFVNAPLNLSANSLAYFWHGLPTLFSSGGALLFPPTRPPLRSSPARFVSDLATELLQTGCPALSPSLFSTIRLVFCPHCAPYFRHDFSINHPPTRTVPLFFFFLTQTSFPPASFVSLQDCFSPRRFPTQTRHETRLFLIPVSLFFPPLPPHRSPPHPFP